MRESFHSSEITGMMLTEVPEFGFKDERKEQTTVLKIMTFSHLQLT